MELVVTVAYNLGKTKITGLDMRLLITEFFECPDHVTFIITHALCIVW